MVSYLTQPEFCAGALEEGLAAVSGLRFTDVAVIKGAYSEKFLTRLHVYREIRGVGFLGKRELPHHKSNNCPPLK